MELIAETAWHHEGDYDFMRNLVESICYKSSADIVKLHITLDLDEYMHRDHDAYKSLKKWLFSEKEWEYLINVIKDSGKKLLLLLNDTKAIEYAFQFQPDFVELHSVCMNVPRLQKALIDKKDYDFKVFLGVGGSSVLEVEKSIEELSSREIVLMFGFQNYPTRYEDINLLKINKIQKMFSELSYGYADHTSWNEPNNELITLLVSSNDMNYIEKHVTTVHGEKRCDSSAAISIDMFNKLHEKLVILDQIKGNGELDLNDGEKAYSVFGPMKMAPIAKKNISKGELLTNSHIDFYRTKEVSEMSQIDIIRMIGNAVSENISKGQIFKWSHF